MRRPLLIAIALAALAISSDTALAAIIQTVPPGSAASSATARFWISSDYLDAGTAQPFAADPFMFEAYVPDQVTYHHPAGSLSPDTFSLTVSGDYTNNGVTTAFSNQNLIFANGAVSDAAFTASSFLTKGDSFSLQAHLDGLLFTSVDAGNGEQIATFNPGSYQIDPNSTSYAYYNGDPQFVGGEATVTAVAVPEPASAALLLTGLLALPLVLNRKHPPKRHA
jgi:hypothetical protein